MLAPTPPPTLHIHLNLILDQDRTIHKRIIHAIRPTTTARDLALAVAAHLLAVNILIRLAVARDDASFEDTRKVESEQRAQRRERGADDADIKFHGGPGGRAGVVPGDVFGDGNEVEGVEAEDGGA